MCKLSWRQHNVFLTRQIFKHQSLETIVFMQLAFCTIIEVSFYNLEILLVFNADFPSSEYLTKKYLKTFKIIFKNVKYDVKLQCRICLKQIFWYCLLNNRAQRTQNNSYSKHTGINVSTLTNSYYRQYQGNKTLFQFLLNYNLKYTLKTCKLVPRFTLGYL